LVLIAFGLVRLLLSAGVLVTYFAYDRQASKVGDLEQTNQKIQMEHVAIGGLLKQQQKTYSREIQQARSNAVRQFIQGFRAGKRADNLPRALRMLEPYVARGLRVPRAVPGELNRAARVTGRAGGTAPAALSAPPLAPSIRWSWPR
jgi:hypothetical protein